MDITRRTHAFLWSAGKMYDSGVDFSKAITLNEKGQILCGPGPASWSTNEPEPKRPSCFLWVDKQIRFLNDQYDYSDLNDAGEIAATASRRFGGQEPPFLRISGRACVWKNGTYRLLPEPRGADGSSATALNNRGVVAGCAAFRKDLRAALWQNGKARLIGPEIHGDIYSGAIPIAINNRDQVIGEANYPDGSTRPFLWEAGKTHYLDFGRWKNSQVGASAINERGQIAGYSTRYDCALLWQDGSIYDLNDHIPTGSGWKLTWATGINDRGQIVGVGKLNKRRHAFLLTPITSPRSREKVTPSSSRQL